MSSTDRQSPQDFYREQREYVIEQERLGQSAYVASADASGIGLVDDEVLVEGMRSVRYATEAHAISDLVDNSIESGASQVHIACHFDGKGNVSEVATLDDGSGMETGFLPHSVRWGATSRKGRRNVFGRFGFGLSSASVNRGKRFAVYSRIDPGDVFHMTGLDLDDLPRDEATGAIRRPGCVEQALPVWVVDYAQKHVSGGVGAVMTVVVWSDLDCMKWHKEKALAHGFMQHLGICYGGWLDTVKIVVQGEAVDPVDPLFITPSHRYFDLEGYPKAIPFFSVEVPIPDLNGEKHMVRVRISHIPVDAYDAQSKAGLQGRPRKIRKAIRAEYNGIFVTRSDRFIELVKPTGGRDTSGFGTWDNYMRQVGIALDFPPALDERFNVTPDKQSILMADSVLDALDAAGVMDAARSAYKAVEQERAKKKAEGDVLKIKDGEVRPSEVVMGKVSDLVGPGKRGTDGTSTGVVQSKEATETAEKELVRLVKEASASTGVDEATVRESIERRLEERPFRVAWASKGANDAFFTPKLVGPQMMLEINTDHAFYSDLYALIPAEASEARSALECLLWSYAKAELSTVGEKLICLRDGRMTTSKWLANALELHPQIYKRAGTKEQAREDDTVGWEDDEDSTAIEAAELQPTD